MDFFRRHAFVIICSVTGIAGIALMITGVRAMPRVLEEMRTAETVHRNLSNLSSNPVSEAQIDAVRQRIDAIVEDRNKVLNKALELYGYEPLVEGALPEGDALACIEFRNKYRREMENLLESLNYGGTATPGDISLARERIANEQAELRELRKEGGDVESLRPPGPTHTPAGVLTEVGVREDALARAHIGAAQRIYCYARHFVGAKPPERVSSLDIRRIMVDDASVDAPDLWEVWHAQLRYWIQRDVVRAINALNRQAAEEAKQRNEEAWVGIMPVKEVISIRLSDGYIPAMGEAFVGPRPGEYTEALPPGTPETVFTQSGQSDLYDVIQFAVKLIMDQRDIPQFIDRMSKDSFHTLLRVSYKAVPVNRAMMNKIYGSEPAVNVIMDFETIMLGEVFRLLMPQSVCEEYEIPCPDRGTE